MSDINRDWNAEAISANAASIDRMRAEIATLRQERDEARQSLESLAWPKHIPCGPDGTVPIADHYRSMAARIVQDRDDKKHENRTLKAEIESLKAPAAVVGSDAAVKSRLEPNGGDSVHSLKKAKAAAEAENARLRARVEWFEQGGGKWAAKYLSWQDDDKGGYDQAIELLASAYDLLAPPAETQRHDTEAS